MSPFDAARLWGRFKIWAPLRATRHPSYYLSHSQFGEDMVVRQLLEETATGFFVEVGAHHPVYYSNTYHFYRRGWRGINIDAAPGSMDAFRVLRPNDVNLEQCIGPADGEPVTFFMFDQPACNTFDEQTARRTESTGRARLVSTAPMRTTTLTTCLDKYGPRDRRIDFLSIDIEGLDDAVLSSLDFGRYAPRVIVFEDHDADLAALDQSSTVRTLRTQGYEVVAKCGPSLIAQQRTDARR
jgi:hypothetical protein